MNISLTLIGAGKMGGAMLQGWLKLGLDAGRTQIIDPHPSAEMIALCAAHGCSLNPAQPGQTDVIVLAIKPQMFDSAGEALNTLLQPSSLLISVMAGKTIANMQARLPDARLFIRAMPNTPAAVGRGITGVYATPAVSEAQRALASTLLGAIGRVEWLENETQIDMVTALSGSGPAYVFYLAECMAKAGEAIGLPPALAARLARATVEGAGELMFQDQSISPSQLRINVTSPAGTTAAALAVLMADTGLSPLMSEAVAAAKRRAEELAG